MFVGRPLIGISLMGRGGRKREREETESRREGGREEERREGGPCMCVRLSVCTRRIQVLLFLFLAPPPLSPRSPSDKNVVCGAQGVCTAVQSAHGKRGYLHAAAACSRGVHQHGLSLSLSLSLCLSAAASCSRELHPHGVVCVRFISYSVHVFFLFSLSLLLSLSHSLTRYFSLSLSAPPSPTPPSSPKLSTLLVSLQVVLFEEQEDAERYAGLLEAQDFPAPQV